jgi:hypothetical protein
MQRALNIVALLIAVVLLVVSPVLQAQAPKLVPPSTTPPVEVNSVLSGMCLQPINGSMEQGATIVQEPCTGSPEQTWVWALPNGDTGWIWGVLMQSGSTTSTLMPWVTHLINGLSGLCLDARGPAANGTPVQQWTCNQISNENWEAGTSDTGILKSLVSGTGKYCLTGGNNTPGLAMQIYSCNNSSAQIWQFQALTPRPLSPPPIEISSVLDGMCLQPNNKSIEQGAAIVQQTCTGFPEQIWFWTLPNGVTHLMNGLSGLCLDARGPADNKTQVEQWPCDQISNENWEAAGTSNKETLKSRISGTSSYCLDIPGGNTTPGSATQIYGCNNSASQIWQFHAQAPPPGTLAPPPIRISSGLSGMCLQPNNKSVEPGAPIVQQTCTGVPEQIWIWVTLSNDESHLMNGLSGLCLDARGPADNGTPVQQWPCDQISNEHWEAVAAVGTPDQEVLKSRVSGTSNYCLDIPGGNKTPGAAMQIYSCNNSASQIWKFGGPLTVVPNVFGWQTVPAANWIDGFNLVPLLQLSASLSLCNSNTAGRIVGEFPAHGTPALRNSAVTLYFCPSS